jgi:hypothetical protein
MHHPHVGEKKVRIMREWKRQKDKDVQVESGHVHLHCYMGENIDNVQV